MTKPQSIAVVGAGIVGVSTAEWLRRDGHTVTLMDRTDPGQPAQTSYGNAGILAATSIVPVPVPGLLAKVPKMLLDPLGPLHLKWSYLPRLLPWLVPFLRRATREDVEKTAAALTNILGDTVEQHKALAGGTGAEHFITDGIYAFLYRSQDACDGDAWAHDLRAQHGARIEFRDLNRLREEDPHLGDHYTYAACYMDHGWISDPGSYVAGLFAHYQSEGGGFQQGEVDDIAPRETGADVTVNGATQSFDHVVLAGGAWSGRLVQALGHKPGLESERGYHLVLKTPNHAPPFPYMLADGKFVATPMEGGLRCAGQVEFGGLDAGPSEAPFRIAKTRIKHLYPNLEWAGEERWLGHRPSTIDSVPFIGPSPKAPQIHFAFGAQHVGLTSGPKTGRLIADMIGGRTPNIDMTPFRVGRFD
ncbi:MAG: FAD-binding oxidoreductase [Pseudomonadota bacterium]